MSNKLVKKSNLGDLSYSDLGLDVRFQVLEAPYLEDGTKMLFKIDDVENFCAYNLNDFADFGSILLLRQNDTSMRTIRKPVFRLMNFWITLRNTILRL